MNDQIEIDIDGLGKRKLSRYMPFFRFAFLLQQGLYVPNAVSFSDRWEGLLGAKLRQRLQGANQDPFSLDEYREAMKWVHVSCWYEGVKENFLMWRAYGASEEAVMIESSVARLEKLYRDSEELHVGYLSEVKYCAPNDEPSNIKLPSLIARWGERRPISAEGRPDMVNLLPQLFVKHDHYDGEREYRLVCLNREHTEVTATPKQGIVLPLQSPQYLIEKIRISPFAPEIVFDTVSLLVEKMVPGVPVVRSNIEVNA